MPVFFFHSKIRPAIPAHKQLSLMGLQPIFDC